MLTPCMTTSYYQSQELQFTLEPIAVVLSCFQINNDLHIIEPRSQLSELNLCCPSSLPHRVGNPFTPHTFLPWIPGHVHHTCLLWFYCQPLPLLGALPWFLFIFLLMVDFSSPDDLPRMKATMSLSSHKNSFWLSGI